MGFQHHFSYICVMKCCPVIPKATADIVVDIFNKKGFMGLARSTNLYLKSALYMEICIYTKDYYITIGRRKRQSNGHW